MKTPDLIYGNVWSKVKIDSQSLSKKINYAMSYEKMVYNPFKKRKERKTISLLRKTKKENLYYFPSGLFYLLAEYPDVHKELIENNFTEGKIFPLLRDYQKDAVLKLLQRPRGILDLSTGGGKSLIMMAIVESIKEDNYILIVVPKSTVLLEQTIKNFREFFDEDEIGWNFGEGNKEGRIMITSPGCADKLSLNGYSVILIDEAQVTPSKGCRKIFTHAKNAIIRYGFSGSPFGRSDGNDLWTVGLLGDVVKVISYEELKDEGYLAECEYVQIFFDSSDLLDNFYTNNPTDWVALTDHFFENNKTRNEIIKRVVNKAVDKDRKILVIVDRIKHGKMLESMIDNSKFIEHKSKNKNGVIKDLNDGNINVLISTSLIDTGIDIPTLNTLVLGSIGKSRIQTLQRIGRTLRPEGGKVYVIDLVDSSNSVLFKHAMQRQSYVTDLGFDYVTVYIRNIKDLERL